MTVTPTYPGVYLREIPSGNRTVTGVATSIAAFVGTAPRGPADEPVPISGFGDFERVFGGLTRSSGLGYAVRDYFLNGGGDALVVRVVHHKDPAPEAKDVAAAPARLHVGALTLEASGPGAWGNALHAKVEYQATASVAADVAAGQGVSPNDLFHLTVSEGTGADAPTETYLNVTTTDGPQRLDLVLASSRLVRVVLPVPAARPPAGEYDVARLAVDTLLLGPGPDAAVWTGGVKGTIALPPAGDPLKTAAEQQGVKTTDLFNLTLEAASAPTGEPTKYDFVTVVDGPRRVDVVLAGSAVARVVGPLPAAPPKAGSYEILKDIVTPGLEGDTPSGNDYIGNEDAQTGIQALRKADLFTILCIPPRTPEGKLDDMVWSPAAALCRERRAFLLVDAPSTESTASLPTWLKGTGLAGLDTRNAALYFPRILRPDPLRGGASAPFAPCGAVAGTYARTDSARGIWKAPAGIEAGLSGVIGLPVVLTDDDSGALNPAGINCLRTFRGTGTVIWGARTLRGNDVLSDEYKYVPVRRLALYLEETLYRNTQWVVFEPNDEALWSQIRLAVGGFMQSLFRQGAFQGTTPRDAYFVRCDHDTTTQYDIDRGIVNIIVGFAPLKPAEFVVIGIQQKTADQA
jgi:phage tail sheath protein FI